MKEEIFTAKARRARRKTKQCKSEHLTTKTTKGTKKSKISERGDFHREDGKSAKKNKTVAKDSPRRSRRTRRKQHSGEMRQESLPRRRKEREEEQNGGKRLATKNTKQQTGECEKIAGYMPAIFFRFEPELIRLSACSPASLLAVCLFTQKSPLRWERFGGDSLEGTHIMRGNQ